MFKEGTFPRSTGEAGEAGEAVEAADDVPVTEPVGEGTWRVVGIRG